MEKGIFVKMVDCLEAEKYKDRVWTTRSDSWKLLGGSELILLEGFSGGFDVDYLKRVPAKEDEFWASFGAEGNI